MKGTEEFEVKVIDAKDLLARGETKTKRWAVGLPDTAEKLLRGRRRKMICQEYMATYLGISRYRLNRMESGEKLIPPEIALKAQERLNRYERDCSTTPSMLVSIFSMDGYSMQLLADASGLAKSRIRAIKHGAVKVAAKDIEALLGVPTKPNRIRNRRRRNKYG